MADTQNQGHKSSVCQMEVTEKRVVHVQVKDSNVLTNANA